MCVCVCVCVCVCCNDQKFDDIHDNGRKHSGRLMIKRSKREVTDAILSLAKKTITKWK